MSKEKTIENYLEKQIEDLKYLKQQLKTYSNMKLVLKSLNNSIAISSKDFSIDYIDS